VLRVDPQLFLEALRLLEGHVRVIALPRPLDQDRVVVVDRARERLRSRRGHAHREVRLPAAGGERRTSEVVLEGGARPMAPPPFEYGVINEHFL
jgi:hypothetical protein